MTESADQTDKTAETWISATDRFVSAAPGLGDLFAPQVRVLRALAEQLDRGDEAPSVAAEYARIHRWLLNKLGGGKATPEEGGPSLADMLPGVNWL